MRAFAESTPEQWDESMRVNVRSLYVFCKAVVPHMTNGGGGSIVNISSGGAGHESTPFMPPGYVDVCRGEGRDGAVLYGTRTRARRRRDRDQRAAARRGEDGAVGARARRGSRLERLGSPEDVVPAVVYLVAQTGAGFTGHVVDSTQFGSVWP